MNENWYWQLAQERQRELLAEARQARLRKEAGVPDTVPGVVKVVGLAVLVLPVAVVLLRAIVRL